MCRSRRELSNAYLLAKIGVDTAENEPLEVWGKNSIHYSLHSLAAPVRTLLHLASVQDTIAAKTALPTAGVLHLFPRRLAAAGVFPSFLRAPRQTDAVHASRVGRSVHERANQLRTERGSGDPIG